MPNPQAEPKSNSLFEVLVHIQVYGRCHTSYPVVANDHVQNKLFSGMLHKPCPGKTSLWDKRCQAHHPAMHPSMCTTDPGV